MLSPRAVAEAGLVWSGVTRLGLHLRRGQTLVLAYHNVVPDDAPPAGDRSLHLRRTGFARQLDLLTDCCDVVPLATALGPSPAGGRPRVAITFDDAYRGALTLAASELAARRLPATMFVPPGLLGADAFWWDVLAGTHGLAPEVRDRALGTHRGDGDAIVASAIREGQVPRDRSIPATHRPGTEAELASWASTPGLTVGSHTWRHPNLTRIPAETLARELVDPLAWLGQRVPGSMLPWITYPYGLCSATVASAARQAGYEGALLVSGGWISRRGADPFRVPRLNVPASLSLRGFRLRLAGLVGTAAASVQQAATPDATQLR